MLRKLLRSDEVATLLDVSLDRVTALAREGHIPAIRCGRAWRFCPEQIDRWILAGGAGGWKRESQVERGHRD
jgi:excisionase family DNA binding protein